MTEPSADRTWLGDDDRATLTAVLDALIPPDEARQLPGAGGLGLVGAVENALADSSQIVLEGLAAVRDCASRGSAFPALGPGPAGDLLNEVSASQPAFLPSLIFHLYVHYYRHPRVLVALGMEARPPYPQGYEIAENDLSLLEPVRGRPKQYREI